MRYMSITAYLVVFSTIAAGCSEVGEAVRLQRALDTEYGYESVRVAHRDGTVEMTVRDDTFSREGPHRSAAHAEELAGVVAERYPPVTDADTLVVILTDRPRESDAEEVGVRFESTWRGRFRFATRQLASEPRTGERRP